MASPQRANLGTNREYKLVFRQRHYYVTYIRSIYSKILEHINTLTNKHKRKYKTYNYISQIICLAFGSFKHYERERKHKMIFIIAER